MPKFIIQQPKTLENLAISGFVKWIELQTCCLTLLPDMPEDQLYAHIEDMQLQIYKVPFILHDAVASQVLKMLAGRAEAYHNNDIVPETEALHKRNVFKLVTETLYTENLTRLSLVPVLVQLFESDILTKLTNLEIAGNCGEVDVINVLKQVPNIKALRYAENCCSSNEVIKYLVKNCMLIEEIDLNGVDSINDQSIYLITQLPNLKSVKLINTSVTEIGIETLLTGCEKVENIQLRNEKETKNYITIALQKIASSKGKVQLKLKSLDDETFPVFEEIQTIVKICPQLQEIDIFELETQDHVTPYNNLHYLRKLNLHYLDFCKDHIIQLLEVKGSNLVALALDCVSININAWADVSRMCPNLKCLNIRFEPLGDTYNRRLKTEAKTLLFKRLQCLHICGHPHDDEITFLLSNCPTVKHLAIYQQVRVLTDNIMIKVLERNPLSCLEKLHIRKSKLTKSVIERIVRNCGLLQMEVEEQLV